MKRIIPLSIPLAIVILLAACSSRQSDNKEHQHGDNTAAIKHDADKGIHDKPKEEQLYSPTAKKAAPVIANDKLNAIYPYYLDLTQALTDGDVAGAKVAANTIMVGAEDMDRGTDLVSQAAKITKASAIESQREVFSGLSAHIIDLVKQAGLQAGELYVSYCSMKNSSWLSNSKQIKNPYYGASMLTCGETKETIQ